MPGALPVSVVIPGYNAAEFVLAALDSVGAQTREPSEVIVVDDGSSDDTALIARRWGARVIVQPNAGVANARNAGVRAATSDWVAFLDGDDRWETNRLGAQWALAEQCPHVRLIASDYRLFDSDGRYGEPVLARLGAYRALRRSPLRGGSLVPREELLAAILERNFVLPSSWLVERAAFERDDLWFCERKHMPSGDDFHIGEDYEWLLRVLRYTDVAFVDEPLVAYRRSSASLSANGGRLRYGDVKLGDMVRAAPERYASGAASAFERVRSRQLREAALRFLAAGDSASAQHMLREAVLTRPEPRSLALLAATSLFASPAGSVAFRRLYALWRERLRPFVRTLRTSR